MRNGGKKELSDYFYKGFFPYLLPSWISLSQYKLLQLSLTDDVCMSRR